MKNKFYLSLTAILVTATLVPLVSFAKTETFKMKPFITAESSKEEIAGGLQLLFKNSLSVEELEKRVGDSQAFQSLVYDTLNTAIAKNPNIQVETSEKTFRGNFVKETTIKFPSLIQRANNHPANTMIARIYEQSVQDKNCDYKYPTTIMLHHILNEVEKIEEAATYISAGILNKPSIVVVIQMPHYAQRRLADGSENFLNSDLASFRKNMAQLILDVHLLKNYIETRSNVDTNHISLTGFSLGAVMGLTIGAFDQSFNSYGFLMGGSDMANILMNRVTSNPTSEVAEALNNSVKNEDYIRSEIGAVDSLTWLHRYKNKETFFLNNSQDVVVKYKENVQPTLDILKANENQVATRVNEGGHVPTGSAFTKFKEIFRPLNDFIMKGAPDKSDVCPMRGGN
ncbi:MAG: hypothetical protein H7256_00580 [Bdellovibrio sp.]|nr:hypothetical protein [Bdellovibrio sp.]